METVRGYVVEIVMNEWSDELVGKVLMRKGRISVRRGRTDLYMHPILRIHLNHVQSVDLGEYSCTCHLNCN